MLASPVTRVANPSTLLSPQPSASLTPRQSFWESLSAQERHESIDHNGRCKDFGSGKGWHSAGIVLKKWNEEVQPAIKLIINDRGNHEAIIGKETSDQPRAARLFMVAMTSDTRHARPTIVTECRNGTIAENLCNLLKNHKKLHDMNLGFGFLAYKINIRFKAGFDAVSEASHERGNLPGSPILVSPSPPPLSQEGPFRHATIGGILEIDGVYFGLTAAHAFSLDNYEDSISVSKPGLKETTLNGLEQRIEEFETVSEMTPSFNFQEDAVFGVYSAFNYLTSHISYQEYLEQPPLIGNMYRNFKGAKDKNILSQFFPEQDCALVELNDQNICIQSKLIIPSHLDIPFDYVPWPHDIIDPFPKGKYVVFTGYSGIVAGYGSGSLCAIDLPGSSEVVDAFVLDCEISEGDCGAWVLDPFTGDFCGMVIASSPDETYFLPSTSILKTISTTLKAEGRVHLPRQRNESRGTSPMTNVSNITKATSATSLSSITDLSLSVDSYSLSQEHPTESISVTTALTSAGLFGEKPYEDSLEKETKIFSSYDALFQHFFYLIATIKSISHNVNPLLLPNTTDGQSAFRIENLYWFWDQVPRLDGLPQNSVDSGSDPDGIVFQEYHILAAQRIIKAFVDAWETQTTAAAHNPRFAVMRRLPNVLLILSVIKDGRYYFAHFVDSHYDDSGLPFSYELLLSVVRNAAMARTILAQQFRAVRRQWATGQHLTCHEHEPLPLLHFTPAGMLGKGSYSTIEKVQDVYTKEVYACKIYRPVAKLEKPWTNEVRTLQELSSASEKHHIVRFIKSYQRGPEIGALLQPLAQTNLSRFLSAYCKQSDPKPSSASAAILRAFGCLSIGLRYLHEDAHIQHHDIKPENILFFEHSTTDTNAKEREEFLWADFGLASRLDSDYRASTAKPPGALPDMYAPDDGELITTTRASDVFSFGCTLLEIHSVLVTGTLDSSDPRCVVQHQPYGKNVKELHQWIASMKNLLREKPTYLKSVLEVLETMVHFDPATRPDMKEVVQKFEEIAAESGELLFCSNCKSSLPLKRRTRRPKLLEITSRRTRLLGNVK